MSDFDYESLIVDIPDYPKPGVTFKDITPLLDNPCGFASLVDTLADHFMESGVTKVLGAEARGFIIGAPIAYRLDAGFVPVRKPGKLPREVLRESFNLEYGNDELQIHKDAVKPGEKVLIIDDLLATGGTVCAMLKLAQQLQADVVGMGFVVELDFLHGRNRIAQITDAPLFSLCKVNN